MALLHLCSPTALIRHGLGVVCVTHHKPRALPSLPPSAPPPSPQPRPPHTAPHLSFCPALMWSVSSVNPTNITTPGSWVDLADLFLHFTVSNTTSTVITYVVTVVADKPHLPGGDFLTDPIFITANQEQTGLGTNGLGDFLGARVVVDGVPYRQSGSHVNPLASLERSARQLRGHLVVNLAPGNHTAKLQWRKWGSYVRGWQSRPDAEDGFVAGRELSVSAEHHYVGFKEPLSLARLGAEGTWEAVRDMSVTVTATRARSHMFMYLIHVRPDAAPGVNGECSVCVPLLCAGSPCPPPPPPSTPPQTPGEHLALQCDSGREAGCVVVCAPAQSSWRRTPCRHG
jgi:hypothetical protein